MRLKLLLVLILLAALFGASFFFPRVNRIEVTGTRQFTPAQIETIAGVRSGMAWLWYRPDTARIAQNPWVQQMRVTRRFPDKVEISVLERVPYARLVWQGQNLVVARDGTVLPGAVSSGPTIAGWGESRRLEALDAAELLAGYGVKSVTYSPSGLRIVTTKGSLWSESLDSLRRYARVLEQEGRVSGASPAKSSLEATMTYIYPWGVSVQK